MVYARSGITPEQLSELSEALEVALKPVKDDLKVVKDDLKHVRARTNQMYDALAKHGLPLPLHVRRHKLTREL